MASYEQQIIRSCFSPTIEGENKPPVDQSGLSKNECERK